MKLNLLKSSLTALFLLIGCCSNSLVMGQSQAVIEKIDDKIVRQQFPEAEVVFLKNDEHLTIDFKNDKWDIARTVQEEMFYLENVGQMYSEKSIYYSSFDSVTDITAKTLVPIKKGKFKEHQVENIDTKDVMMGSVFYSDHKQKKFIFPAVQPGAITSLEYTEKTEEPYLLGSFYFRSYAPVLSANFSVSFPKNIEITYKLLGKNTDNIQFQQSEEKDWITYTWTAENVEEFEPEENAPSSSYYAPHVVVYINRVTANGKEKQVLTDVSGLYKWYSSLVENVNQGENAELAAIAQSLTEGVTDTTEKVKRIFQWVQDNIKYVAFEDGLGGFVPREAADVCTKKYGDCKDMSSLIVEMLEKVNVPAHLTWIGTRDRPYTYHEVPTPIVDNHMIASTKINGEIIFLDATGEYVPFGMPTSMIQGKQALIGLDKQTYELVHVPEVPKEENVIAESISLSVNNRDLLGSATANFSGYRKVFAQYERLKAEGDEDNKFFNDFLRKGNNKFEILKVDGGDFFNRKKENTIQYDFKIPGYVKKVGSKLYINLNLVRMLQDKDIDIEKRKLDKKVEFKHINQYKVALQIPEGYEVHYLPENDSYADAEFGFKTTYEQEGNQIILQQQVFRDHLMLKKERFEDWNKMIHKLNDTYQEVIVLKKTE